MTMAKFEFQNLFSEVTNAPRIVVRMYNIHLFILTILIHAFIVSFNLFIQWSIIFIHSFFHSRFIYSSSLYFILFFLRSFKYIFSYFSSGIYLLLNLVYFSDQQSPLPLPISQLSMPFLLVLFFFYFSSLFDIALFFSLVSFMHCFFLQKPIH